MPQGNKPADRQTLEQAIAAQESLRGQVADVVLDTAIAALRAQLAALRPNEIVEQRKMVTVLFMDIVGSTTIVRDLDPEDNMMIMDTALQRLAEPVQVHGGRVTRFMGDGFKALFGGVVARENDPEMAVRAGLEILSAAQDYAQEIKTRWQIENFNVRVGINTGLVMLGGFSEAEDTIMGTAVNLAARLESAAAPGTVLISHDTCRQVRELFDMEVLDPIVAKGFPERVPVYRVLRPKPRSFRSYRRGVEGVEIGMIGRSNELKALQTAFQSIANAGQRQVITLVGEAGLGKSRLLYEFENWLDEQKSPIRIFKSRARPETQGVPYGLIRNLFDFQFEIFDEEPTLTIHTKLESGIQKTLGVHALGEMKVHFIGQMLGYNFSTSPHLKDVLKNPREIRDRALRYLTEYARLIMKSSILVLLLDDLHWADDSSLDAIQKFAMGLPDQPVLIVGTARPDLYERRFSWDLSRPFYQRLDLHTLSLHETRQLIGALLQHLGQVPETLTDLVIDNSGGNPFYVEELIKMLVEDGVIIKAEPHWKITAERLAEARVPPTLTGVLQARLDRLDSHQHQILHQASVIGRKFWKQVLRTMNQSGIQDSLAEEEMEQCIGYLLNRELIFDRATTEIPGTREYIFKHVILREVTYEQVLLRHRRLYHRVAADWLIENCQDRENVFLGQIADHLELAEDYARACTYLLKAGQQAARQYANEEALTSFTRALTHMPPDRLSTRWEALEARIEILQRLGYRDRQKADLKTLEAVANQSGELSKKTASVYQWALYYYKIGENDASQDASRRTIEMANQIGDKGLQAGGYLTWGRALWRKGNYLEARERFNEALPLAQAGGDRELESTILLNLGNVVGDLGDNQAAEAYYLRSLAIDRENGDHINEGITLNNLGILAAVSGDLTKAQQYFEQALDIAQTTGDRSSEGLALGNLGHVSADRGDYAASKRFFEQYLANTIEIMNRHSEGYALNGLGHALNGLGQYREAAEYYQKAVELRDELRQHHLALESRAGWAQSVMMGGDSAQALVLLEPILVFEETSGKLEQVDSMDCYLICIQVLQASHDPRASSLLAYAYQQIQEQVEKIGDSQEKQAFLENVPAHREILRLWEIQFSGLEAMEDIADGE